MNRRVWIFGIISMVTALLIASMAVAFAQGGGGKGQEEITICHEGHTITVAAPALAAHERHGDVEGDCTVDGGSDDPAESVMTT